MGWYAKPSGAYNINSEEAYSNMLEMYALLSDTWTLEAICGMLGNVNAESGYNPWRWQSDTYDESKGYGLVQFTPGSGYIRGYGVGVSGYAPNLSTSSITSGALPTDGRAQTLVIKDDLAHKYSSSGRICRYADLTDLKTFSGYKENTNLWLTTCAWLNYYEAPKYRYLAIAQSRYESAITCYEKLGGVDPPRPHIPRNKMPLYMYTRRNMPY